MWSRRQPRRVIVGALCVAFAFQVFFIAAVQAFAPEGQHGFLVSQFPVTHLFEFFIGLAAGLWCRRGGREWVAQGHRRTAMLFVSIVPLVLLSQFRPVDPAFLLMSPFFALLISALGVSPKKRSWLAAPWLVLLGEASFSLYMIHVPLLNIYSLFEPPAAAGWSLAALTIGISVVIFATFETPARLLVKRLLPRLVVDPPRSRTARRRPRSGKLVS